MSLIPIKKDELKSSLFLSSTFRLYSGSESSPFYISEVLISSETEKEDFDFDSYEQAVENAFYYFKRLWAGEEKKYTSLLRSSSLFWKRIGNTLKRKDKKSESLAFLKERIANAKEKQAMTLAEFSEKELDSYFTPEKLYLTAPIMEIGTRLYILSSSGFIDGRGIDILEREVTGLVLSESGQSTEQHVVSIDYLINENQELPSLSGINDGELILFDSEMKIFTSQEKAKERISRLLSSLNITFVDNDTTIYDGEVSTGEISISEFKKRTEQSKKDNTTLYLLSLLEDSD